MKTELAYTLMLVLLPGTCSGQGSQRRRPPKRKWEQSPRIRAVCTDTLVSARPARLPDPSIVWAWGSTRRCGH